MPILLSSHLQQAKSFACFCIFGEKNVRRTDPSDRITHVKIFNRNFIVRQFLSTLRRRISVIIFPYVH